MTDDWKRELIEEMARAIWCYDGSADWDDQNQYTKDERMLEARAALAVALPAIIERCAQVCEARYMGDNNREDMEAKRCAAAIREIGGSRE